MAEFIWSEFVKNTLIESIENGMFAKEQANELAQNYYEKGTLSVTDVQEVAEAEVRGEQEVEECAEPGRRM